MECHEGIMSFENSKPLRGESDMKDRKCRDMRRRPTTRIFCAVRSDCGSNAEIEEAQIYATIASAITRMEID